VRSTSPPTHLTDLLSKSFQPEAREEPPSVGRFLKKQATSCGRGEETASDCGEKELGKDSISSSAKKKWGGLLQTGTRSAKKGLEKQERLAPALGKSKGGDQKNNN